MNVIEQLKNRQHSPKHGNKKQIITIGAIAALIIFCIGASLYYSKTAPIEISQTITEIQCGETYAIEDLAEGSRNVSLSVDGFGDNIRIDELGEAKLDFIGKRGKKTKKQTLSFKVVDETPPQIAFAGNPTIKVGDSEKAIVKALDHLEVTDAIDTEIDSSDVKVEGEYDTNVPGQYTVQIVATDDSGNTAAKETTLTVDDDSISWEDAIDHIGEKAIVRGPLKSVVYRQDVNGSPTFINIGRDYPNKSRFQAIVWGVDLYGNLEERVENLHNYYYDGGEDGIVEIKGTIEYYEGFAEIIVRDAEQLIFPTNW